MRQTWHFFDATTGLFTGRTFTGESGTEVHNVPKGVIAVTGVVDPFSQRYDVDAKQLIDYKPPAPSLDHFWDETKKRWALTPEAQEKIYLKNRAASQIDMLNLSSIPILRRAALGDSGAMAELLTLDAKIRGLEKLL